MNQIKGKGCMCIRGDHLHGYTIGNALLDIHNGINKKQKHLLFTQQQIEVPLFISLLRICHLSNTCF